MVLESIETKNVFDFRLIVNDEVMNLDNEIKFLEGDRIKVKISRDDEFGASEVTLVGYDPNTVIDSTLPEVTIDEPIDEEDIIVNPIKNDE